MLTQKLEKKFKSLTSPEKVFNYLNSKGLFNFLPDKFFLKVFYRVRTGKRLNIDNPKTFNEKLHWLKLNDRKSVYSTFVDKYKVRNYISKVIGEEYLVPLIGVYDHFNDIPFAHLPIKFVIKTTHDSGGVVVCKNKKSLNINMIRKKINKSLNRNYYYFGREWVYKNITPRIIIEEYLTDEKLNKSGLVDFKFYCFNGEPHYCQVIQGRGGYETIDFYDMDWNHMPFNGTRLLPMSKNKIEKPKKLDEMIKISRILSKNIPFIRVDLYYVNNKIYFGELTFFPSSGTGSFRPPEWNLKMGELIKLPFE